MKNNKLTGLTPGYKRPVIKLYQFMHLVIVMIIDKLINETKWRV